jgi:cation:H+ antiporter
MPVSLLDVTLLALAIPFAALGGEAFLKGVIGTADCLRLPRFLVATTLAAFATSSPELTVSTLAALAGEPAIGLGDALGSNVVNISLVLGLALLFGPLEATRAQMKRDYALALGVPLLTVGLAADGALTRFDGLLLLSVFATWLAVTTRHAVQWRTAAKPESGSPPHLPAIAIAAYLLGGLIALVIAGKLFVTGASSIATALGIHAYIIGATVVAIGTSLPELVTTLLSRLRGHDDIGIGTLLGSNLFNGLAIVGVAASIHPIDVPIAEIAVAAGVGMLSLLLLWPRGDSLSRRRGIFLLLIYAAFVTATVTLG